MHPSRAVAPTSPPRVRRAERLRADLRAVWVDGLAWAVMVGMGEQSLSAFAVALGLPVPWGGLVVTLPMVAGATLQLASPPAIRRLGSHKRWVVLCVVVQAAVFLPLALGALHGALGGALGGAALYALATVYWWSALASGPAWNSWVGTVVPARVRVRYFTNRTRWLQALQITALIGAGLILQAGSGWDRPLAAFAVVFLFALVARTLSAACLTAQSEPDPLPGGLQPVGALEFVRRFRSGDDGRFLAYALALQFAANVAAPFFVPYMLRELSLSFAEVMTLLAAAVLGKFVALPLHGRLIERQGVRGLLWFAGLCVPWTVVPWLFSDRYEILLLAQFAGGVAWSAWELATFLSFFEAIRAGERTSTLTSYQWANAAAIAGGSLLGGWVLALGDGAPAAYLVVFAGSGLLRLATLPLLARAARPRVRAPGARA
jgi:hypothetical protein